MPSSVGPIPAWCLRPHDARPRDCSRLEDCRQVARALATPATWQCCSLWAVRGWRSRGKRERSGREGIRHHLQLFKDGPSKRPAYFPQMPAQQTPHPAPPVQSELSRQKCGTHHLGPVPVPFVTHFSMKRSLAGPASILPIACSAQAICTSASHFFTKLIRALPASFCPVAFALQVRSAAAVALITTPQSTRIRSETFH